MTADDSEPCSVCQFHVTAKALEIYSESPPAPLFSDLRTCSAQDELITLSALSASEVQANLGQSVKFGFGAIDYIVTEQGKVSIPDMNGTNSAAANSIHPLALKLLNHSISNALGLASIGTRLPVVIAVGYANASGSTRGDKLLVASSIFCSLHHDGIPVEVIGPAELGRLPLNERKAWIVMGPVDRLIPHFEISEAGLTLGGMPVLSLYDLMVPRMSMARPADFPRRIVMSESGLITQWGHLDAHLRKTFVNSTYEITGNPPNVNLLASRLSAEFPFLEPIPAQVATDPASLADALEHFAAKYDCLVIKAPSSRGTGTMHVYSKDSSPREVRSRLFARLQEAYGAQVEDSIFPVLVSKCVPHQDVVRNGTRSRYYDARFVVFADGDGTIRSCPAMVRYLEVPDQGRCPNEVFCQLSPEQVEQEKHFALANKETMRAMGLNETMLGKMALCASTAFRNALLASSPREVVC